LEHKRVLQLQKRYYNCEHLLFRHPLLPDTILAKLFNYR